MSKAEVNNEIVLMRKAVRQAKVQCIRKWVRKADHLKKRKGNEEQVQKNKLHSEKIVAQIIGVKKVKDDDITRFALTDTRTQKQILDDQKLSPRERGIALISFCPKFQDKIAEFKKKYPNYLEFLDGKKNYKGKGQIKQDKSAAEKTEKSSTKKLKESSKKVEKIEKEDDEEEKEDDDSSSSEDLARKFNIKPGSMMRLKPTEDESSEDDSETEIVPEKKMKTVNEKGKKNSKVEKDNTQISPKKKVEEVQEEMQLEADPFFTSSDSTPYMRVKIQKSCDVNQPENQEKNFKRFNNDKFSNRNFSNDKFKARNERFETKQFGKGRFGDKFNSKFKQQNNVQQEKFERKSNKGDFKWKNQVGNKTDSPNKQKVSQARKVKSPEKQQNLHPSWEAKKKQQEALKLGFQGKKIVFDD